MCPWPASLKQNSVLLWCCLLLDLSCQCSLKQCSLTIHPGQQNICCLCRMGTAAQRLEKLDNETAALATEVKNAKNKWLSATDPQQEAKLQKVYEDLTKEREQLDSRRKELEATLPGAGERSIVSVLISPTFGQ